jgi:hypothetical protein
MEWELILMGAGWIEKFSVTLWMLSSVAVLLLLKVAGGL